MSQYTRRLEAIPLSWDALSEQQRNAVEAASGWLVDAMTPLKNRPDESHKSGPVLDRNRRSQIGFIDGDRGMGKSSVLLTLQALTTEDVFFAEDNAKSPADKDRAKILVENRARYFPSTMKLHYQERSHIVWLETLDMEPLSKGVNLFAAILARIEHELDTHLNKLPPMAAALAEPDGYAGAADKLRQLQQDAAIVWDRTDGGGYSADPPTRALWVNQAEKAGLELNHRIGEVLNAMALARWNRRSENPLFVLPVDDFDLAPCHCLELLRLIRMITTPRLFFLVAGNTRIGEVVLKLRTEGDLLILTERKPLRPEEVIRHAAEIAANNMRKLLPPGQRVRLATLRITEALDGIKANTDTEEDSLRTKLEAINFEINQAPTSHAEMSFASFLLPDEDVLGNIIIAEWLAGTPRQVLDRIEMFAQLAKAKIGSQTKNQSDLTPSEIAQHQREKNERDDRLIERLFEEIQREISEDALVPFDLRERLLDTFDTSVSISLDLNYLRVEQHDSYQRLLPPKECELVNVTPTSTRVSVATGKQVSQQAELKERGEEVTIALPRRIGITLLLLHDFVASLWGGYLRHSPLTYRSKLGPKVEARWEIGSGYYNAFFWNKPEWWTFRDFDRFAKHWSLHVDQCNGQYGLAWLTAILEVVLNEKCQPGSAGLTQDRLKGFLERLVDESPIRTARRLLRDSSLAAITVLFAPESAGGLTNINQFRDNEFDFFAKTNNPEIAGRIRQIRADRWGIAWNNGIINDPQRAFLCELIAPRLAWNIAIKEMESILKDIGKDDVILPSQLDLEPNRSKTEVLTALNNLKQSVPNIFIQYKKGTEADRFKQLLITAECSYNSMPEFVNTPQTSGFNLLENRAFIPTEEDIKRVQQ